MGKKLPKRRRRFCFWRAKRSAGVLVLSTPTSYSCTTIKIAFSLNSLRRQILSMTKKEFAPHNSQSQDDAVWQKPGRQKTTTVLQIPGPSACQSCIQSLTPVNFSCPYDYEQGALHTLTRWDPPIHPPILTLWHSFTWQERTITLISEVVLQSGQWWCGVCWDLPP